MSSTLNPEVVRDKTVEHSKRAKDIAIDQVRLAATVGSEAVTSGVYLYPLDGVYYLLRHLHLWKPMRKPLLYSVLLSVVVTSTMFFWTYLPQAGFLCIFNGPLGFATAVPLVLGESATLVLFIARAFWLAPALDKVFDGVLLDQGLTSLVEQGREIQGQGKGKSLGKSLMSPLNRFSKEGLITYLLSLPLNAIPVVGTVFFLLFNGSKSGPNFHARYFQLKHFTPEQKNAFIKSKRGSYTAFGTATAVLNLIPAVSILFAFSNAAGAALWASDIEKKAGTQVDTDASNDATQDLSESGKKTE